MEPNVDTLNDTPESGETESRETEQEGVDQQKAPEGAPVTEGGQTQDAKDARIAELELALKHTEYRSNQQINEVKAELEKMKSGGTEAQQEAALWQNMLQTAFNEEAALLDEAPTQREIDNAKRRAEIRARDHYITAVELRKRDQKLQALEAEVKTAKPQYSRVQAELAAHPELKGKSQEEIIAFYAEEREKMKTEKKSAPGGGMVGGGGNAIPAKPKKPGIPASFVKEFKEVHPQITDKETLDKRIARGWDKMSESTKKSYQ